MAIEKLKEFPIVKSLEKTFDKLVSGGFVVPDFSHTQTVACVSDYAGDRETDGHYAYTFIFYDYNNSGLFKETIDALRAAEPAWKDRSYIEYKKITKDKVRRRLLPQLLEAADTLNGVIIVFYVDKEIPSLFADRKSEISKFCKDNDLGDWKPHIAEKLFQVLLIQSFFASKFIQNHNKYFWYSDRDAINDEGKGRVEYVGKLLSHFFGSFELNPSYCGFATEFTDTNYFGDIMSIADLCSGATLEYYEQQLGEDLVKESSNEILKWFAANSPTLKKIKLRIRLNDDNSLTISEVEYFLK
jgi:hypothetical protein